MKHVSIIKLAAIAMLFIGVSNMHLQAGGWDPTTSKGWKQVGDALKVPKKGSNGTLCSHNDDCDSHACIANMCRSKLKKGEACTNDGQCKNGLYCSSHAAVSKGDIFGQICASQLADGADCQSDGACKSGNCQGHKSGSGNYGKCVAQQENNVKK